MRFKTSLLTTALLFSFTSTVLSQQNALHFDGTNDKVDCGNDASVQITGTAITLEAWIYAESWSTNVWEGCIVTKENFGSPGGYMLRAGAGGKLNFEFGNGSSWVGVTTASNTLSLNTWHHVAGSYDGSKLRVYVDGVPVDSLSNSTSIVNTTYTLIIGDYPNGNRVWDGKIDEVRIWDITRSKAQIQSSVDSTYCWAHTGLKAYYKFNQGMNGANNSNETTLQDVSGNGNHGTLSGFALTGATSNWVSGASVNAPAGAPMTSTSLTVCEQFISPSGNYVWTTSGTYIDTLASALNQCDSIVTYNLTVNYGPTGQDSVTACHKYVSPYTGQTITASGTFVDSVPAPSGCDSLLTTEVTILPVNSTGVVSDTVCSPVFAYTSPSGKYTWTSPGVYSDTVMQTGGCQNVTIFLTLYDPTVSVTVNATTLETPTVFNASYQWIDCDNGNTAITGATSNTYTATANGNYAVIVSHGPCSDTSACAAVTEVGVDEIQANLFSVYPNPSQGIFTIEGLQNLNNAAVMVTDLAGRVVYSGSFISNTKTINLTTSGVYVLTVTSEYGRQIEQIIVK